jgi:hypothetical protein
MNEKNLLSSYGSFNYSKEFKEYIKNYYNNTYFEREMYEALKRASGYYCKLKVKTIPKHREYISHEYDGAESVEILKDFC